MFELIKKIFIGLLTGTVYASNHTKCLPLSNQKCVTQPTLINSHLSEYSLEFYYYSFAVKLDRCVGSFNTLNGLSYKNRRFSKQNGRFEFNCALHNHRNK